MSGVDSLKMLIIHQIVSKTIEFCKKENSTILAMINNDFDFDWEADMSKVSILSPD